ncbi:28S ribosomal protein S31, mitochondrial [Tribolium madens]|uniref:28S ribosomal protein S31, mitochondrial n=1 Tax=Tribolium madens TaxID=41895 RepID=UPI001CF75B89|nr:28S ribosomal protein S31, mitochondrial [Tribolium madens]
MSKIHLLTRFGQIKINLLKRHGRVLHAAQLSSSSDDEKKIQKKEEETKKSNEALKKLNNLLKTMIEDDVKPNDRKLDLAKPPNRRQKDNQQEKKKPIETPETQMTKVVKDVAETLGGNVKQTESELLMKLLEGKTSTNLVDLVKGMKVDTEKTPHEQSKAQQVRGVLQGITQEKRISTRRPRMKPELSGPIEKIDLFGSPSLGIFTDKENVDEGVENKTWNDLYQKDLKLAVTHPPGNYFQQMILWTEQEKIWKFPIDNEQGLDEEKKVYFTEHVFLEKYLEPWCPQRGPLRHFMELVCVGLSKNPYLTVDAKKEHIEWFKNYFEEKKQLLKEVGAIQDQKNTQQIEQNTTL